MGFFGKVATSGEGSGTREHGAGRRGKAQPPHRSPGHLRRAAAMAFLPDESRSLPPPPLLNKGSVWLGFLGWLSALADNAFNKRPVFRAGVHRQILFTSVGYFVGYQLVKRAEYVYAKVDRELLEYIRNHPVDFRSAGEKKKIGQLLEDFHPVR